MVCMLNTRQVIPPAASSWATGDRDRDRLTAGDEGQVTAVLDLSGLPNGEAAALGMHICTMAALPRRTSTGIGRVVDGLDRLPGLEIIGRRDDGDVDGAEGGVIVY